MSMVINHNMMAARTANALNSHYGNLSTSTQRLSTGLRINSAADDAAGLAIRELQRADIAALHQGARNANDAVSMIQVADGALGIIDEKLIRMKELAEQAATGTYDSTQRLMIESEYQQMASEITRIAHATDFNGIHLLDGSLHGDHDGSGMTAQGKLKVHFGTANDSAEDYYYIEMGEATSEAFSIGNASTWEDASSRIKNIFKDTLTKEMGGLTALKKADGTVYEVDHEVLQNMTENWITEFNAQLDAISHPTADTYEDIMKVWKNSGFLEAGQENTYTLPKNEDGSYLSWDQFNDLSWREKQRWQYALGRAAMYNYANGTLDPGNQTDYGLNDALDALERPLKDTNFQEEFSEADDGQDYKNAKIDDIAIDTAESGDLADAARAALDRSLKDAWAKGKKYNYAGLTIQTQEDAQIALNAINDAIVEKDNIRAHLGAMQNRLENTITNLNTQAENLQAAESRISDVDVATEMTEFVRNQILTQSAVAMLSQANSLPQMAMQLIGG